MLAEPHRAAHVKGAGLRPALEWYAARHGRQRVLALLEALPPTTRALFDLRDAHWGVLVSHWYPAPDVHTLLEAMTAGLPVAERVAAAREIGRAAAESTLTGVYRLLFQAMLTPERYARHVQTLFNRYFDDGVIAKQALGARLHHTTIHDWGGHHPLLCELFLSSSLYVYAALGCREVRSQRLACVSDGSPACVYDISWDD